MATIEEKELMRQHKIQRRNRVCQDYLALRQQYPEAAPTCLMDTLAYRYRREGKGLPTTSVGVRGILIRSGLYTSSKS